MSKQPGQAPQSREKLLIYNSVTSLVGRSRR